MTRDCPANCMCDWAPIYCVPVLRGVLLILGAHTTVFGFFLLVNGSPGIPLVATPLATSTLVALFASFSRNASFRTAAVTAACVSSLVPMFPLVVLVLGWFYAPGFILLVIALVSNAAAVQGAVFRTISLVMGLVAGVLFLLSYWPLITAYDSCHHLDRGRTYECVGAFSRQPLAAGFALMALAILLLFLTNLVSRQRRSTVARLVISSAS